MIYFFQSLIIYLNAWFIFLLHLSLLRLKTYFSIYPFGVSQWSRAAPLGWLFHNLRCTLLKAVQFSCKYCAITSKKRGGTKFLLLWVNGCHHFWTNPTSSLYRLSPIASPSPSVASQIICISHEPITGFCFAIWFFSSFFFNLTFYPDLCLSSLILLLWTA